MTNKVRENAFNVFDDISPKKKDPTIQVLYEYEKHYLELVKKYRNEIEFINNLQNEYRQEQIDFYRDILPSIVNKLGEDDGIDDDMKKIWSKRVEGNINNSFRLTETVLNDFTVKKIDEFKKAVNNKLNNI